MFEMVRWMFEMRFSGFGCLVVTAKSLDAVVKLELGLLRLVPFSPRRKEMEM
jgi:hypothetical protein